MTTHRRPFFFAVLAAVLMCAPETPHRAVSAQAAIDWPGIERETMEHFQAVLRFDTSDPPSRA